MEFPRVAVAVSVGETPLQFLLRQRVKVELVLVVDAAAHCLDDFLRQFVLFLFVAFNQLHPETFLDAGEVEILPFQAPFAGTDIVEHIRHFLAILKGGGIDLPRRVEGGAIGVEVHRAGLVYVKVGSIEVIVKGVLVGVVAENMGERGVLRHTAGGRDN